jgi:hypothetical protein
MKVSRLKRKDEFERLEELAERLVRAGWKQIWQVTDTWWMVGFQRKKAVIIVAVIGARVRVFSPTNQKFQIAKEERQSS